MKKKIKRALILIFIIILITIFFYKIIIIINPNFSFTGKALLWSEMPITYTFIKPTEEYINCPDYQIQRLKQAFEIIENKTNGLVRFSEQDNGELSVSCSGAEADGNYMKEGEAVYNFREEFVVGASLTFFNHQNCGNWPDVEIHEILHLFGYEHINNTKSIMNPIATKCDLGEIDNEIIQDLIDTYSEPLASNTEPILSPPNLSPEQNNSILQNNKTTLIISLIILIISLTIFLITWHLKKSKP